MQFTEEVFRDRMILLYFGSLIGSQSKLGMNPVKKKTITAVSSRTDSDAPGSVIEHLQDH